VPAGTAADALQTTRQEPVGWVCPLKVGQNGGEAPRLATRHLGLLRTWAKDIGLKPLDPIALIGFGCPSIHMCNLVLVNLC